MPKMEYVLMETEKSRCPLCSGTVELLARRDATGAMFYICYTDRIVAQVGVGRVGKEVREDEREEGD